MRTAIRKVDDAVHQRDTDAAEKALAEASKLLDRHGNHKTVHPNAAARRKSRLAKRVNALKATGK